MNRKKITIIVAELLVLIFIVILVNTTNIAQKTPECWFYQSTGLECPSCGGTRCVINLFSGNFKEAFFLHPIYFIIIFYLLIVSVIYIINLNKQEKIAKWLYPKAWYAIMFAIILVIYGLVRNMI